MKKLLVLLLCLMMLLSLFSCGGNDRNDDLPSENVEENNHSQDENTSYVPLDKNDSDALDVYKPVLEVYRKAIDHCKRLDGIVNQNPQALAFELFGLEASSEKEWFINLLDVSYLLYRVRTSPHYKLSCGYAIKDLNGDGVDELVILDDSHMVGAIFSAVDGKPVFLRGYSQRDRGWIDEKGWIHENGSSGADYSTNAVYKIADGGASMVRIAEFGTNGVEWVDDVAYTKYYQLVNGEKVDITETEYKALNEQYGKYLGIYAGAEATKECAGLTFTSLYTEAEIAMEMYESAVNDEICVWDEQLREVKLKVCRFPSNDLRLDKSIFYGKVILDMDQDGICEYIIQSYAHDSILLHYYDGKVYSFAFAFKELNNLKEDGSFYWSGPFIQDENSLTGVYNSGAKKLSFDGANIKFEDIYKTVYDQNGNAKYYISDREVTYEAMIEYLKTIPNDFVEYTPFEAPWYNVISEEEAVRIASEYWGIKVGDVDAETGYPFAIIPKYSEGSNYHIALSWLVEGQHYSTIEIIQINAFTGEIIAPTYEPEGKG